MRASRPATGADARRPDARHRYTDPAGDGPAVRPARRIRVVPRSDAGPPTVSGSGIWQISRVLEVERLRAELNELRGQHGRELAAARKTAQQADDRWASAEGKLVEAMLELGEAEQRAALLLAERDEASQAAGLERTAILSRLDRLNAAMTSAGAGQAEADRLAEEALRRYDAASDDLKYEEASGLALGQLVEELRAEIKTTREAEAAVLAEFERLKTETDGFAASLLEENRKLAGDLEHSGARVPGYSRRTRTSPNWRNGSSRRIRRSARRPCNSWPSVGDCRSEGAGHARRPGGRSEAGRNRRGRSAPRGEPAAHGRDRAGAEEAERLQATLALELDGSQMFPPLPAECGRARVDLSPSHDGELLSGEFDRLAARPAGRARLWDRRPDVRRARRRPRGVPGPVGRGREPTCCRGLGVTS